jgi:ABC-2 type transport system ATP-binding protein
MPDTPAIEIDGISKRFENHVAVRDLSLTVPRGTVYGLLGPNGAGKTTTIRMILNIIVPDTGTIRVLGTSSRAPGAIDRVGYLPEERGLYKKMQVRRVLQFLGELKGLTRRESDRGIDMWLERLGLRTAEKDWGTAKVDELSRGMQQKVQFIGTLLHDPELVILDEPFSGLDPINAQALTDAVGDLRARGRTVVFSTHLIDSAERMCDNVCVIANGTRLLDGTVAGIKATHAGRTVVLSLSDTPTDGVDAILHDPTLVTRFDHARRPFEIELAVGADPQTLLSRLVNAGGRITRFEVTQPSLHRIFLDTVGATGVADGVTGHG